MEVKGLEPGQLVTSRAGRDFGRHYLVYRLVDEGRAALVVDGEGRGCKKPKRKNLRHLLSHSLRDPEVGAKCAAGTATDAEIRHALRQLVKALDSTPSVVPAGNQDGNRAGEGARV